MAAAARSVAAPNPIIAMEQSHLSVYNHDIHKYTKCCMLEISAGSTPPGEDCCLPRR